MTLKNIIIIALCSSIALFIFLSLSYTGIFQNASFVRFGYEEEYIGSKTISLCPLSSTLLMLLNGLFYISFALFLQKIKSGIANKMLCNIALFVWCYAAFVTLFYNALYAYIGWIYNGQEIISDTAGYWQEEGIARYPLLYMVLFNDIFDNGWSVGGLFRFIPWMLSYVLLIPVFVSVKKVNKALSITGVITMVVSFIFCLYIYFPPMVHLIYNACWVATFAVALKGYESNKLPY